MSCILFLVFAKVSVALPDLEPEIVCCNQRTGKSDGMGVLQFTETSNSVNVNIQAARKSLTNECIFAKGLSLFAVKRYFLTKFIIFQLLPSILHSNGA